MKPPAASAVVASSRQVIAFYRSMENIRAASVQFHHTTGDPEANLSTIRHFVQSAAEQQVKLICFPEMCITGYWALRRASRDELLSLAEPVPYGRSSRELLRLSEKYDMTIGAGLVEIDGDGCLYNTFVVAMPNGRAERHRKLHCFINASMSSGNEYTVFDTPHGFRVGVLICYDNNIIENVRITALLGADVLMAPHQTGGCQSRSPRAMGKIDPALWEARDQDPEAIEAEFRGPKGREWLMRWLPSRAHDNGLFILFSNGVGVDDNEVRTGNAMILDAYGELLAETSRAGDDMVVADLDGSMLELSTGRRWITARRPDLYGAISTPTGRELDTRLVRFAGLPR